MLNRLARFIERHPALHGVSLRIWRLFPARVAGRLKGLLASNWLVGAAAVLIDEETSPPEVLLVEHSYRTRGVWGLPGGSLEAIPGNPKAPGHAPSPDDAVEATLRREVREEIGIDLVVRRLLRIDAVPFVPEEPGPRRLDFYFLCAPAGGFAALRDGLRSAEIRPRSPEIRRIRLVPLTELGRYDLFSTDDRFLRDDLPRLEPSLAPAGNPESPRVPGTGTLGAEAITTPGPDRP